MREDLIQSATSFLTDPNVQSAALTKKVSFLESKGMTAEEIEEAMARVNGKSTGAATTTTVAAATPAAAGPVAAVPGGAIAHAQPFVPQRPSYDWRDIFVAAALAGGVSYGVWTLAKKLLGPWFQVPTQKELEEDKEKLDAQFQAVEDSLKDLKQQTSDALSKVSSQSKKIDDSLSGLETVLKDLKQGDAERDQEFKNVKADVKNLKELVPQMLDRNKDSQAGVLTDLQNEVQSLKSLLVSRRPLNPTESVSSPNGSATPAHVTTTTSTDSPASPSGLSARLHSALNSSNRNRPGIPAWQMAASGGANGNTNGKASEQPAAGATSSSSSSSTPAA
ncbi:peroxisomal membrane anchor protein conserved region-domain-containing protein [Zychaea mexicana]|uniref:peroxisomal membrane anchor protein conserved region-domain-containing protein n=1 Tax=Zychaea mexicana TaxID=64656 RepID=UPI0022FE0EC0|nr:peroxisomal membrane anchor protein conserved region-domain-containing protein [Zychaea mexicana]KAI9497424.1 peroxisomal membrane anchor protein conserved region-domain-containing protein [Zychaea mexicana]